MDTADDDDDKKATTRTHKSIFRSKNKQHSLTDDFQFISF